jgi:hypothetical protein
MEELKKILANNMEIIDYDLMELEYLENHSDGIVEREFISPMI